jgi:hypothetical protein
VADGPAEKDARKAADDLAALRRTVDTLQQQLIEVTAMAHLAAEALEAKQ